MVDADSERKGALLTKGQREFLKSGYGDGNGGNSKRVKRQRLRKRVQNAIVDLTLLTEHLDARDRELIFSEYGVDEELSDGVISAFELLFLGLDDATDRDSLGKTGYRNRAFDSALKTGVKDACNREDMLLTDWELEYQTVSEEQVEEMREWVRKGETAGPEAVRLLHKAGDIEGEDLQEFLLSQIEE